jgi:hypothetical protein
VSLLRQVAADVAAELYRGQADPPVDLLEFSDGVFDALFDAANERTVLMHGLSRQAPPNSRDTSYHRSFPGRAGFDKGHAISHAQGGREGGPNYFRKPRGSTGAFRRLVRCGAISRAVSQAIWTLLLCPADLSGRLIDGRAG